MANVAVIVPTTLAGSVSNVIVADANRDSFPGAFLVNLPDGVSVNAGDTYDNTNGFTPQTPPQTTPPNTVPAN